MSLVLSCAPSKLVPDKYMQWVNDKSNGLLVESVMDEINFKLRYKPLDYIYLTEYNGQLDIIEKDSFIKPLEGYQYFDFIISPSDKNKNLISEHAGQVYYERLMYFSTLIQNDLFLIDGKDTIPCAFSHHERTYNASPNQVFVLAFELPRHQKNTTDYEDKSLVYSDKILGLNKNIVLTIKASDLNNIPQLSAD